MRINNRLGIVFILIVLSLLCIKDANALGISPGRKTIDFEPNSEKDVTLTVFNNERRDFTATIFIRGELGSYIELGETMLKFSSEDSEKSFDYRIRLPEKIDKPGSHQAEIVVREISEAEGGEDIVIGALVAVVSQLEVKVPYPGKYAVASLDIVSTKPNEEVKFFIRVSNLGEEDIGNARAIITILDQNDDEVAKINTDSKEIKAKDRKELMGRWAANVSLGEYKAIAAVYYDDLATMVEGSFTLGDFFLNPLDISVKNFKLGQIAKFNILMENLANRRIEDAAAQLILLDENENKIMDIKSMPDEIEALGKKELIAYWDTENIKEGTYAGKIILSYEDKKAERQIRTKVSEDKIETEIIGITGLVIGVEEPEEGSAFTKKQILMWGILILILVNIGWFLYFLKSRKK